MPRLPEIFDRDELPECVRHVHDELVRARGKVANSYAAMFHAPELVGKIASLGTHVRFESDLPRQVLELVAITASAEFDNSYEVVAHGPDASKAGVPAIVVAALAMKQPIEGADTAVANVVAWIRELARTRRVSQYTFDAVRAEFGDKGAVEFFGAVGFYAMLALVHNALEVRPPEVRA